MKTYRMPCKFLIAVLAGFALYAADAKPKKAKASEVDLKAMCASNLSSVVFCVIDGEPMTAEYVRDNVLFTVKLLQLGGTKLSPARIPAWGNSYAMKIVPQLISAKLLSKHIAESGISATPESDAKTLERFNKQTRSNAASKEELSGKFGDLKDVFLRNFAIESARLAYFDTIPELKVDDDDVRAFYSVKTNTLKYLEKLDVEARGKASTVMARLKAGEEWETVARECSEDALLSDDYAEYYKEWGHFLPKNIEPAELASAVDSLEVGGWTEPIETDEGLVIAKVLEKEGSIVSLARILLRLPIRLKIPDREEAIRQIREGKVEEFQQELLPELREKAKLEYPLGPRFKYEIWPAKERKTRKAKE